MTQRQLGRNGYLHRYYLLFMFVIYGHPNIMYPFFCRMGRCTTVPKFFLGGADLSQNSAFYTDTLAPQTIVFPIRTGKSTSNPGNLVRGALSASSYGLVSFTETPLDFEAPVFLEITPR